MTSSNIYKYTTLGLLVLNIILIAFFLMPHMPPGGHERELPAHEIMDLDKTQGEQFLQYAEAHIQLMDKLNEEQRSVLKDFFDQVLHPENKVDSDSLLTLYQAVEQRKIQSTLQHFQEIRSILKPEQQAGFEEFVRVALKRILLEDKKNHHPPKDF